MSRPQATEEERQPQLDFPAWLRLEHEKVRVAKPPLLPIPQLLVVTS